MPPAVLAEGLVKKYGDVRALDGLDFRIEAGTVVGLLGHNGAGKSTAVRVLSTLVRPDGGRASVAGFDVAREPGRVREQIALAGQQATLDELLTGRENLVLLGRLLQLSRRDAKARAAELLERVDLVSAGDRIVKTYSGGMRRRLDLAACLVVPRPVVFLDEPTTGLDPASRIRMWEAIQALADGGAALLLTTQHLDEADRLADRVTVLSRGRAVAEGTPGELKDRVGGRRIEVTVSARDVERTVLVLRDRGFAPKLDIRARRVSAPAEDGAPDLELVLDALRATGVEVEEAALRRPTLDDAFLALTNEELPAELEEVA